MSALTQRLLALEAANQTTAEAPLPAAMRVLERLRGSLSRFAGPEGFNALLRRALGLARAEYPSLQTVQVGQDGRLEGLEALLVGVDAAAEAATAITTHLLGLLVTFVGEVITLRLVREAWPDAAWAGNYPNEVNP